MASQSPLPPPEPSEGGDIPLDFLSFMLGQQANDLNPSPQPHPNIFDQVQPEAGPSNVSIYSKASSGESGSLVNTPDDSGMIRGSNHRRRKRLGSPSSGVAGGGGGGMDLDSGMGTMGSRNDEGQGMMGNGGVSGNEAGFDVSQAGLLQQQLEHIHMQSPLFFDANQGDNSAFSPLAQMFFTSPVPSQRQPQSQSQTHTQTHAQQQSHPLSQSQTSQGNNVNAQAQDGQRHGRKWSNGMAGVLTPGPSGDMNPQWRTDLMSPMHLEMLARGDSMDGNPNFNMIPLLSPALSLQTSTPYISQQYHPNQYSRSPLEQLQDQQRQFQEQLVLLQEQQRQLQVTAAAVAVGNSYPNSNNSNTPSTNPSPQYFSPLTSPALEPSMRYAQHGFSPAINGMRQPHPLSGLSSPALNPVGSNGGAQQTLSPALGPQSGADMADPDYIRALAGLEGDSVVHGQQQQQQYQHQNQQYHSPVIAQHQQQHVNYPTSMPSPLVGPNRQSIPSKSRPSPMMKPTNHRSHSRQPSGSHGYSIPNSPVVQISRFHSSAPGIGYLPPSAIDQRGVLQGNGDDSTPSTPSPVDLSHMMPPPPVPSQGKRGAGITPMTPASLMNLGSSGAQQAVGGSKKQVPMVANGVGRKGSTMVSAGSIIGRKAGPGQTQVPTKGPTGVNGGIAGKRVLAMRPAGSSRFSKATAPAPSPAPETRKTSHKAAEQKRRDSLKAGFDELRLLLPPINTEALDPISGEPIPGSSAPRLLPKSSLVPDDNPNRGVSKVALLRFSNEYIGRLSERMEKRDRYIELLRREIGRLRADGGESEGEVRGEEGEDLLDLDMEEGEEDEFGPPPGLMNGEEEDEDDVEGEGDEDMEDLDEEDQEELPPRNTRPKRAKSLSQGGDQAWKKSPVVGAVKGRPGLLVRNSSGGTITLRNALKRGAE